MLEQYRVFDSSGRCLVSETVDTRMMEIDLSLTDDMKKVQEPRGRRSERGGRLDLVYSR